MIFSAYICDIFTDNKPQTFYSFVDSFLLICIDQFIPWYACLFYSTFRTARHQRCFWSTQSSACFAALQILYILCGFSGCWYHNWHLHCSWLPQKRGFLLGVIYTSAPFCPLVGSIFHNTSKHTDLQEDYRSSKAYFNEQLAKGT